MKAFEGNRAADFEGLERYPELLRSFLSGHEFMPMIDSPIRADHRAECSDFLRKLTRLPPSSEQLSEDFHTKWHVGHHFLRELVEDDGLMLDAAWVWLPRYTGPGLDLYRGENIDRFEAGRLGSAWSDRRATAEMFASGLSAVGKGGVILRAAVSAEAVIAGPSWHSAEWLGENEFTVDTRKLGAVVAIERFPPSH